MGKIVAITQLSTENTGIINEITLTLNRKSGNILQSTGRINNKMGRITNSTGRINAAREESEKLREELVIRWVIFVMLPVTGMLFPVNRLQRCGSL